MLSLKPNRAIIIEDNGNCNEYKLIDGLMHHEIIEKFCSKKNYSSNNESIITENGHVYLRIVDDTVIGYLPNNLTEMQIYYLEMLIDEMNELTYLGVIMDSEEGKKTIRFKDPENKEKNIGMKFSEKIIPLYTSARQHKKDII